MLDWPILWYVRQKFPDVCHMTTDDLDTRLNRTSISNQPDETSKTISEPKNPIVIVDCRRRDEFEVSHIPDAKCLHFQTEDRILLDFLLEETQKYLNIDTATDEINVVCYCSLGYRSSMLAQRIEKLTKSDSALNRKSIKVWNLEGSIFKWANENRHMIDTNKKPTKFAHPFSYTFCMFLQKDYWKWTPDVKEES